MKFIQVLVAVFTGVLLNGCGGNIRSVMEDIHDTPEFTERITGAHVDAAQRVCVLEGTKHDYQIERGWAVLTDIKASGAGAYVYVDANYTSLKLNNKNSAVSGTMRLLFNLETVADEQRNEMVRNVGMHKQRIAQRGKCRQIVSNKIYYKDFWPAATLCHHPQQTFSRLTIPICFDVYSNETAIADFIKDTGRICFALPVAALGDALAVTAIVWIPVAIVWAPEAAAVGNPVAIGLVVVGVAGYWVICAALSGM